MADEKHAQPARAEDKPRKAQVPSGGEVAAGEAPGHAERQAAQRLAAESVGAGEVTVHGINTRGVTLRKSSDPNSDEYQPSAGTEPVDHEVWLHYVPEGGTGDPSAARLVVARGETVTDARAASLKALV
jgi:hypothetical protein